MSRFRFAAPTEAEAREFLAWRKTKREFQVELHADTLACQRRLRPVVSPAELQANREFVLRNSRKNVT